VKSECGFVNKTTNLSLNLNQPVSAAVLVLYKAYNPVNGRVGEAVDYLKEERKRRWRVVAGI